LGRTYLTALGLVAAAFVCAFLLTRRQLANEGSGGTWESSRVIECRGTADGWVFRGAGPDARLGTSDDPVSRDLLPLPADTDVRLQVVSDDYLFRFAQPELGFNVMAIPGRVEVVELHTGSAGRFELETQPMCGGPLLHAANRPAIVIGSEEG